MPKKMKKEGKPIVHEELEGFDIRVNEFGQMVSNYKIEKLNKFLNKTVNDKKLKDSKQEEE